MGSSTEAPMLRRRYRRNRNLRLFNLNLFSTTSQLVAYLRRLSPLRRLQIFNMLKNQWTSSIIVHCIALIIYRYSDIICLIRIIEVCRSLQINVRRSSAVREKHLHMDINTSVSCESAICICMYTLKTEVLTFNTLRVLHSI